jgi:hypothetical protein
MNILYDDPVIFDLMPNVVVEEKSPTKVILRNTATGNKTSLNDKADIAIVSSFISERPVYVETLESTLKIDKRRILKLFKKLDKRGFLTNVSKEYQLPDTQQ